MRDAYRTLPSMPPMEKPMRRITAEEKKEKTSSIECFRGVQFISFILSCLATAFSTHTMMSNAMSQHSYSFIIAGGAGLFGLFATMRIRSLRQIENLYWEQQSAKEHTT